MVSTIVEDRRFEKMLIDFKRPAKAKGCCGRKKAVKLQAVADEEAAALGTAEPLTKRVAEEDDGPPEEDEKKKSCCCGGKDESAEAVRVLTEEEELKKVFEDRTERLDDLCKLMYVGEDLSLIHI